MTRLGLILTVLLALAGSVVLVETARADTESCVGSVEYDNTERGLSPLQVANRYDIYGQFLDDTQARYRREYRTCWNPGVRKVVVEYSYDTNTSVDWYVRDV